MEKREFNTVIALAIGVGFFAGLVGGGIAGYTVYRTMKVPRAQFQRMQPMPVGWRSTDAAAPDSVEGQLRSRGKHWVRTTGDIAEGSYVVDILEGRQNQPKGRGAVGKVLSVGPGENGATAAQVDFGHGWMVGLDVREISLVSVSP